MRRALAVVLSVACAAPPQPITLPSRTVTIPVHGCTVVVVEQPGGAELDMCLSAADLEPLLRSRRQGGR